jgi:type I restriction enzyme R subunit
VSRSEAEGRRGFDPEGATPEDRARTASLYFGDLLHAQVRAFNPKYKGAEGALMGEFQRLNADIAGNRDFLTCLRNQGKFFCAAERRRGLAEGRFSNLPFPGQKQGGQECQLTVEGKP